MLTHRVTIFEVPSEALGRTLVLSVLTHLLLVFSVFFLPGIVSSTKEPWGDANGGSGAISVGMVQNIRGLNLPQPEMTTQTKIASESKGLGQTEPAKTEVKEPEVPDPKAFEVQDKKKEPKRPERPVQKAPPQIAKNVPPPRKWFPSEKEELPASPTRSSALRAVPVALESAMVCLDRSTAGT